MRQSHLLLETFRRYLRHQSITYAALAKKLGQSESNIKRIFSQQTISLDGLEEMCGAVGIELLELAKMSMSQKEDPNLLTQEQEEELAADPKFFSFAYLILLGWSIEKIMSQYSFSKKECELLLHRLDKIKLIRLHSDYRIERIVSRNVRWNDGGPLMKLYQDDIKKEFMKSEFLDQNERIRFLNARLSKHSVAVLSNRIDRLINEFVALAEIDEISGNEKMDNIWFAVAYRPWSFSTISQYRKKG